MNNGNERTPDPAQTSPMADPNSNELDEILESYAKYQYQLHVDNDGSHQMNKREAKVALESLITKRVTENNKSIAKRLQAEIARYGDGEIVYHNREAVVPISKVLSALFLTDAPDDTQNNGSSGENPTSKQASQEGPEAPGGGV